MAKDTFDAVLASVPQGATAGRVTSRGTHYEPTIPVQTRKYSVVSQFDCGGIYIRPRRFITLTKQPQYPVGDARPKSGAGAPEIQTEEVTLAMIEAGEAVLDRAFQRADLQPSWTVFSALRDVYTAMANARDCQGSCSPDDRSGAKFSDGQ